MKVHQVLSQAGPRDAITTQALEFRSLFGAWGWGGADYAVQVAPGLNGAISRMSRRSWDPRDVVLLHHSAGLPRMGEFVSLPNPKLLLYHNVTPPSLLWDQAPVIAAQCLVGREQLPELVRAVDMAAGVSAFNARELEAVGARSTRVVPLLLRLERLGTPEGEPPDPPTILFVGRLSPHKHQEDVIRAFALYRAHHASEARLSLVGDPVSAAYAKGLRRIAQSLAPGAVTIESGLSELELGKRYRAAHAFLCLSEHEGFCAPLLEAFHFGVPVVARPAGAVPEVVGEAGLLIEDDDLAVVAELLHLAISDRELRAVLRHRARNRLDTYAPEQVAARLREVVEATAAGVPAS